MCTTPLKYYVDLVHSLTPAPKTETQILQTLTGNTQVNLQSPILITGSTALSICCDCPGQLCQYNGYYLSGRETWSKFTEFFSVPHRSSSCEFYPTECCQSQIMSINTYLSFNEGIQTSNPSGVTTDFINRCCNDYRQLDLGMNGFGFTGVTSASSLLNIGIIESGGFYLQSIYSYFSGRSENFKYQYLKYLLDRGFASNCAESDQLSPVNTPQNSIFISTLEDAFKPCEVVGLVNTACFNYRVSATTTTNGTITYRRCDNQLFTNLAVSLPWNNGGVIQFYRDYCVRGDYGPPTVVGPFASVTPTNFCFCGILSPCT